MISLVLNHWLVERSAFRSDFSKRIILCVLKSEAFSDEPVIGRLCKMVLSLLMRWSVWKLAVKSDELIHQQLIKFTGSQVPGYSRLLIVASWQSPFDNLRFFVHFEPKVFVFYFHLLNKTNSSAILPLSTCQLNCRLFKTHAFWRHSFLQSLPTITATAFVSTTIFWSSSSLRAPFRLAL